MTEIESAFIPARDGHPEIPVVVRRSPFDTRRVDIEMRGGLSVGQMVEGCEFPAELLPLVHAFIDDLPVPREEWAHVRPRPGATVYICVLPGKDDKNPLAAVLTLAVAVAAIAFAPQLGAAILGEGLAATAVAGTTLGTIVGGLVINLVGSLIIGALVQPPSIGGFSSSQPLSSPTFQITGSSNRRNPYGPIPRIYGKRRVYPVLAANPYTESAGNDQYLRMLLCVGYGPVRVSDIRIGETPIDEFEGVEIEITEGGPDGWAGNRAITLYTQTIREEPLSIELRYGVDDPDGGWISRFTQLEAREATFDLTFPRGLTSFNDSGDRTNRTVTVEAQYRRAGQAEGVGWIVIPSFVVTDATTSAVRVTKRVLFPTADQWEIRLRRVTNVANTRTLDATFWSALRSVIYVPPVREPGLCLIAVRIKASEQLNGVPRQINCIAEAYVQVLLSNGQFQWRVTSNPAWAYLDLLRRRGRETLIPDNRIDLQGIRNWALACEADAPNGDPLYWRFDGVVEGGSVFEALRTVAAHGRASFTLRDGKYSVVRDVPQTVPIQHITPRNSWAYTGRKQFIDLPHALKVRFINEEKGYVEDERIVYADGFTEATATRFESIELFGCTQKGQAWREGRYFLAVGKLRPEEHVVTMDVEALRCTLGDLVRFSQDAVSIGLGSGRIVQRVLNAQGRVAQLRLDGEVQMDAGRSYAMRVRRWDGASAVISLVTSPGLQEIVTLQSSLPLADAPDEGDLFMFGESTRESSPMLIKRIEPGRDLTARITMVDAQPGVWTADTGPIPAFDTNITLPGPLQQQQPSAPTFQLRSDETALLRLPDGTLQDRIAVLLDPPGASVVSVAGFEAQFKETGAQGWLVAPRTTADAREMFLSPVAQGIAYDVRVRSLSEDGVPSAWTLVQGHVVVGKTSNPANVTGLTAISKVDGVQLSWTPNAEIDLAGYVVRRGPSWDNSELVTASFAGTTLFVSLQTAEPQQFMVRAVDTIGLLSLTAATVNTAVLAPETVPRLEVYPQDDRVRLTWTEVEGVGNLYEIREGASWDLGRLVLRAAGSTTLVQWPTSQSGDRFFWIRALSAAGLYSPFSTGTSTAQAPVSDRNVVIVRDLPALGFPGIVHDLTRQTVAGLTSLRLDKAGAINLASGEYFGTIDLGREWYARNWIELRATSAQGSNLTWQDANYSWDAAGQATWLGTLSDIAGVEVTPQIYLPGYAEPGLVEGWTLAGTTTGLSGTTAANAVGVHYDDGYFRQGAFIDDLCTIDWSKNVPSQFSTTLDVAVGDMVEGYAIVLRLNGPSGWLQLGHDEALGVFFLEDRLGNRLEVAVPVEDGDVITLGINQSSTQRALYVATRRYPDVVADVDLFAPVGGFTTVALHA